MAVPSNTVSVRRDNIAAGVPFSIDMLVLEASQVVIEYGDGVRAVKDTDFTVSNVNEFGFTVTPTPAFIGKIGATNTVYINRETADTSDFTENDSFIRRRIATEFDRNTMRDQETGEKVSRAVLARPGEAGVRLPPLAGRAGTTLQWSPDGHDIVVGDIAGDAGLEALTTRLDNHEASNVEAFAFLQTGLGQVSLAAIQAASDAGDALATAIASQNLVEAFRATRGVANGLATLGSDGVLTVAQRPPAANVRITHFSPFDYGGVGDGIADDTAAVNACFTDLRAKAGQTQGPAQGYITQQKLTVDLRGGMWRITGNGIDATNIQAWNLEIKGGLLIGETAGKPIMDLVGSRGYSLNGTGFFGVKDPAKRPSKAYVVARNIVGAQACDNTSFIEVSTTGWYTQTATHVYGHETALHLHCTYFNYNHDAFVSIFEGFNAHPISSAFSGVLTGAVSFINNKVDICDFRYLPVDDNIRSVSNITIGPNPTVTTSPAHAFANGDKVVFAYVGGQGALQREVATVADASGSTFTAQGVTTTGTFTGGGNVIRAQTKATLYLARAQDFNFDSCYVVAYGQPHLEIGFPDTSFPRMDDIQLDILFEGSGQNHNVAFDPAGQNVSIQGITLTTYNSAAKLSVMGATGGQVSLYDVKYASYNQQGSAEVALPRANFAFYGAQMVVPLPGYITPASYAAFKGRVLTVSDGAVSDYGIAGSGAASTSGTWTPVLQASSGSLSSYTASGTWRKQGNLVYVTMTMNIANQGSGSGTLQCTNMPFPRISEASAFGGRVVSGSGSAGYMLQAFGGVPNPSLLNIAQYDALYVGKTGFDMRLTGVYEVA